MGAIKIENKENNWNKYDARGDSKYNFKSRKKHHPRVTSSGGWYYWFLDCAKIAVKNDNEKEVSTGT